jgi:hypothetical protein
VARGFGHLREEPTTRTLVLTLSGLNLAVSPALALGVALRAQGEGWGAGAVGLMQALVALGAAVGALVLLRWRPRREAVVGFWLLVIQGLAIVGIGAGSLVTTAVSCAVIGVTAGAASSLLGAVFMASIDGAYLGRMTSILQLGDDVLMPAAMAAFGALAAVYGVGAACAAYGLAMALLMALPLSRPTIRAISLRPEPELVGSQP